MMVKWKGMAGHICRHSERSVLTVGAPSIGVSLQQRPRPHLSKIHATEARRPQLKREQSESREGGEGGGVATAEIGSASSPASSTTVEYQRQQAKELQRYFRDLKDESQTERQRLFGWTRRAEIQNGRWVMFGLAVGMLTEYATGVSFTDQIKLLISYMGIADIYD